MAIGVDAASNKILRSLTSNDRTLLGPLLEEVALARHDKIEVPQGIIEHAYFVETGMVSMVAKGIVDAGQQIEVGMIGFEGMTGLALVLGVDTSPNESMVQTSGSGLRIAAADLKSALLSSATLRATMLRYVHAFAAQTTQTALANGRGKLEERLARWLLMWSDRLRSHELPITHEFLALLLGVRRQSATTTLHALEGKQLIRSNRGLIQLRDRPGLLLIADGFYGVAEAEYERIMEPVV